MISTQDLVKGVDLTALVDVGGTQLNQLVDVGRLATDKGMIIETQDSGPDVPVVPDPNTSYSGITPTWWTKYIWRRVPFEGEDTEIFNYIWDANAVDDPVFLQWVLIDKAGRDSLSIAQEALADAATAQNTADTAQTNANNAQTSADAAQTDVDTLNATVEAITASIAILDETLNDLWTPGDLKHTCKTTIYSTAENQGWVECDGSTISRTIFSALFAAIGTTWGPGDGSTTFKVPDFRGRCLVGKGTGAGLTARELGLTNAGAETHLLSGAESGTSAHTHFLAANEIVPTTGATLTNANRVAYDGESGEERYILQGTNTAATLGLSSASVAADAASAHNNMPPFGVARIVMKS